METPLTDVHNVVRDGAQVSLEYKRRFSWHRRIELTAESADRARELQDILPQEHSAGFEKRWSELSEYNRRVKEAGVRVWVTPAVVAANVLLFAAMAIFGGNLGGFPPQLYLAGLTSGLDNLFTYGGGDPRQLLTLTSDWRRLCQAD